MPIRINIKGAIVPNDYKWFYEWLETDCVCPNDVEKALAEAKGKPVDVHINSPGGVIDVGSEIYTMLRAYEGDVKEYVIGEACSAASVIAMARYCEMSPTALMMVHCVWTGASGNHADFEHVAEMLRTADESIANAYMAKTGMSKEEALEMMDHETWFTAEQAKEKGLIDAIMFESKEPSRFVASNFALPSAEQMEKVKQMMKEQSQSPTGGNEPVFLMQKAKLNLLKLKGVNNHE